MKKLLTICLIITIAFTVNAQFSSDDVLSNNMENLKGDVVSIIERSYFSDKNGVTDVEPYQTYIFSINENKQIKEVQWISTVYDADIVYSYTFETDSLHYIKNEIIKGKKYNKSLTAINNFTYGARIELEDGYQLILKSKENEVFKEFLFDKKNNIIRVSQEKGWEHDKYKYNRQGERIEEKSYLDKLTKYERNEYGDVIKKSVFDLKLKNYTYKYEYAYTYDKNKNWIIKREVNIKFNEYFGNIVKYRYEDHKREIKYKVDNLFPETINKTKHTTTNSKKAIETKKEPTLQENRDGIFKDLRSDTTDNENKNNYSIIDQFGFFKEDFDIPSELQKCIDLIDNKEYEKAIIALNLLIKNNPDRMDVYFFRGKAKYNLENYKDAVNDLNAYIKLIP